jgi:membrane-bound lytic murein transglycosylase B
MHAESEHVDDVSSAGAIGLMQIMPDTWTELRRRYNLGADPFDPHDNIIAGAAYLRELLSRYDNVSAMLAAYNAGPSRYDEYLASGRPLPTETREYVTKLAPLMGGKALPESAAAALPRLGDWRDAPLFAVVAAGGSSVGIRPASDHRTASRESTSGNGDTPSSTLSSSIFVPVTSGHSAP